MQTETKGITATPPRLIASIAAGFNTVANHIYLILFPIALDLLLWLGPRLRINTLSEPFISQFNRVILEMGTANSAEMVRVGKEFWETMLERFNLLGFLRTFPVGIASLFSTSAPATSPLGDPFLLEIPSLASMLGLGLLLIITGLLMGSIYFHEVARCSSAEKSTFSLQQMTWQFLQTLLLTVSLVIIVLMFAIPTLMTVSVLLLFSPAIAQIGLFFMSLLMLWLFLPLVFAPHGIFANRQNALAAMRTSVRMVRFFLPGTGLFLITLLVFSQGMDVIWRVPPETSWMSMIGVFGHAFVTTALLSASFFFYSGSIRWMTENLKRVGSKGMRI